MSTSDPASAATEGIVRVDTAEPGIVLVTLNRPERLNALNPAIVSELHRVFAELDADPEVRVVVLTGAGRGFCSGADLKSPHRCHDSCTGDPDGVAAPPARGAGASAHPARPSCCSRVASSMRPKRGRWTWCSMSCRRISCPMA